MSSDASNRRSRSCIRQDQLRRLRNEIPFKLLFGELNWPCKLSASGQLVFPCPLCKESTTAVNPRTNLARCFRCERNWNPIDFTVEVTSMDFLETVGFLEGLLSDSRAKHDEFS